MVAGKEENLPRTSITGGASAFPTPANNTDGGKGRGDKGSVKGGGKAVSSNGHGLGHTPAPNPAASFGNYLGLSEQKEAARNNDARRVAESAAATDPTTASGGETCETEDHSFMRHKPGCPETLPGMSYVKGVLGRATKYDRGE
ncbi:hypothetical protein BGW36DRAFT_3790 [Talaromyces proteolyticus]|uniref:Uncharacterized protein n=1 Tax=Talaromyces proteolyticus TaxID=1131652 RepID=A0AAD4L1J8_9EURO|nr:uncharacterized protein BGW36DRAFT_3790 [Talaromyces proteolyticus]KAH8704910.1 hypothetical protein BGW36DRAFT_3790 [Talaromyces proteolyticus]